VSGIDDEESAGGISEVSDAEFNGLVKTLKGMTPVQKTIAIPKEGELPSEYRRGYVDGYNNAIADVIRTIKTLYQE